MPFGRKKTAEDGQRIFDQRLKTVNTVNRQEIEDGARDYEKHYTTGRYQFNHRHRSQYSGGFWIGIVVYAPVLLAS